MMENISGLGSILLGAMFVLAYFANLSTKRKKRQWLYVGFLVTVVCYSIFSAIYSSYQNSVTESWLLFYNLFCGIGFVLPQLLSRTAIRQIIKHPVIFMQKNEPSFAIAFVAILALVYLPWMALVWHASKITEWEFVSSEFIFSSISLLLFFIPFFILLFEISDQRTALCENGICQYGLLLEWADFKSYSWIQDKIYDDPDVQPFLDKNIKIKLLIEPTKSLFNKPIQLSIPFGEKNAIEDFLSQRIKVQ
jgi:hypothetical protein